MDTIPALIDPWRWPDSADRTLDDDTHHPFDPLSLEVQAVADLDALLAYARAGGESLLLTAGPRGARWILGGLPVAVPRGLA